MVSIALSVSRWQRAPQRPHPAASWCADLKLDNLGSTKPSRPSSCCWYYCSGEPCGEGSRTAPTAPLTSRSHAVAELEQVVPIALPDPGIVAQVLSIHHAKVPNFTSASVTDVNLSLQKKRIQVFGPRFRKIVFLFGLFRRSHRKSGTKSLNQLSIQFHKSVLRF